MTTGASNSPEIHLKTSDSRQSAFKLVILQEKCYPLSE